MACSVDRAERSATVSPDLIERLFIPRLRRPPEPIPPGLYPFMREQAGQYSRFHLRVDPSGDGLLIANATAVVRLSSSGVVIAKMLLDGVNDEVILKDLQQRFEGGSPDQLQRDVNQMRQFLDQLADPGDLYPIFNLEDPAVSPWDAHLMPPLAATLPLSGDDPAQQIAIVDRLWRAGIPHLTIQISGVPDGEHLANLVQWAEETGLICGVSGRASDLLAHPLLDDLAQAGLDHVTAYYASAEPDLHDELFGPGDHRAAQELFSQTQSLQIADVAHIPLIQPTIAVLEETLSSLQELQAPNAAFYAIATTEESPGDAISAEAMRQVASNVESAASLARVRYLWEPPVSRQEGVSLVQQVRAGPRCSGDMAIRVEADGSVIPPRGPYQVAGNLLRSEWPVIWGHPAFRRYRERVERPTRCTVCPGLAICAADCPGEPAGWSQAPSPEDTHA